MKDWSVGYVLQSHLELANRDYIAIDARIVVQNNMRNNVDKFIHFNVGTYIRRELGASGATSAFSPEAIKQVEALICD